ncbi:MAG: exopolysaccharide biosynthesis polyprenyl glycosylphosphotransferase [Lachnospiraceae bacterium]|nr:exopolysaccharide biosynthesis polyprenyl glycosylphosphotransferase [Lachnospiraceae bacterium]
MSSKIESAKRVLVLHMDVALLLIQAAIYAYGWFRYYYPLLQTPRISMEGFTIGEGMQLYFRGHLLVLLLYFVLQTFFFRTYGGRNSGYQKPLRVFSSHIFSLFLVNTLTYFQLSLMRNWLVPVRIMLLIYAVQLAVSILWIYLTDVLYRMVFPARQMLLIGGERPAGEILTKFESRRDRYHITKSIRLQEGDARILQALEEKPGGVILWDIPVEDRNRLLKECYSRNIRVYIMPRITDVILKGADQMHLFDTPIFMIQEYALRVEQRFMKRLIDIVLSLLLLIIASPLMLLSAIIIKAYDRGPVLYTQTRCTQHMREFRMIKFRSMRTDAEADGVARLAAQEDPRITPYGRFIRRCRIDELPQLYNILRGDMSFIGPRPERPEIIAQYMKSMPEFAYRTRVKAGLAGYAQVYGKYNTTPYDKLKLDLTYIENYSVWLDLRLMLLTLRILFTPESTEGVGEQQITALRGERDAGDDG